MIIIFRDWLHKKFNIHYWYRYSSVGKTDYIDLTQSPVGTVSFRTCFICGLWQRWDELRTQWIDQNPMNLLKKDYGDDGIN